MIKPGEYIQLIEFFSTNQSFIQNYCFYENIEIIEGAKRFDELREANGKFKKECDKYLLYPHLDLKQMILWREEIEKICKQFKVRVLFTDFKTTDFKKGFCAYYFHEKTNITNLILFNKVRDKSFVSH